MHSVVHSTTFWQACSQAPLRFSPPCLMPAPLPDACPPCRYLVDLVGISASNRLAAQLGINSAVLKQASRESEWYYRAIQVRQGGTTKRYSTMVGRGGTTEPHRRDAAAAPQEARLPFCIVPCQPGRPRLHCKVQAWAGTPAGNWLLWAVPRVHGADPLSSPSCSPACTTCLSGLTTPPTYCSWCNGSRGTPPTMRWRGAWPPMGR